MRPLVVQRAAAIFGVVFGLICSSIGCSSGAPAPVTALGNYRLAPTDIAKPMVAVAPMKVDGASTAGASQTPGGATLGDEAADEMARLLEKSGRFGVVPRTKLVDLLAQANATDALRPGALVRPVSLSGIDYLVVGTITNLDVAKRKETADTWQKMKNWVQQSSQNKSVSVTTDCGVGFSLVDPSTGDVVLTNNSEFTFTGPATALGLDVTQAEASSPGDLPVNDEDRLQVIRLALDDAIHKSLAKTDRFLESRHDANAPTVAAAAPATQAAPGVASPPAAAPIASPPSASAPPGTQPTAARPAAAKKICPVCGAENAATAKFCRQCGAKLQ